MIKLLSFVYILEGYLYILEDLYYNSPCHKEVGNSRPAYTNKTKKLFNKKYTLTELLNDITPETKHEAVEFGPSVGNEIW